MIVRLAVCFAVVALFALMPRTESLASKPMALLPPTITVTEAAPPHGLRDWFFSPGFAGIAAILAAIVAFFAARHQASGVVNAAQIQANVLKANQEAQRIREDGAVKRHLRGFLVDALFDVALIYEEPSRSLDRFSGSVQAFLDRARERDVPVAIDDQQMSALQRAIASADQMQKSMPLMQTDLLSIPDDDEEDSRAKRIAMHSVIAIGLTVAAAHLAFALHWLDTSDRWMADVHLPNKLTESATWDRIYSGAIKATASA